MSRTVWKTSALTIILALAIAGAVQAQQHHQQGPQASEEQAIWAADETAAQAPMMHRMQGMMEHMQGMMEHMQGMMGMMGGPGMMATADEDEDDNEDMSPGGMMGVMGGRGMQGMMGRGGMMGHGHMLLRKLDRLAEQLNLTPEQRTQIRALARTHMKEAIQTRADMAALRIDLSALLDAESVDVAKVKETLQSLAAQRANLAFAHVTLMQEINQLLTPEQQQQFRTLRRQMLHGGGMKGMMSRGGMHGQGGMMGRRGMMGQGGMRGPGGMRNPCGMMGRGAGSQ